MMICAVKDVKSKVSYIYFIAISNLHLLLLANSS